jgi:uncharacterized LabA/DUF88 family protein
MNLSGQVGVVMGQSANFLDNSSVAVTGNWALLIDGENVAASYAEEILSVHPEAFSVRRVYGNLKALSGWPLRPELKVINTEVGRNSADILLTIEAMMLALAGTRDFVIVSGDGGTIHLVRHLRERGCRVVVVAGANASPALRAAGHHFIPVGVKSSAITKVNVGKQTVPQSTVVPAPKKKSKQKLEPFLLKTLGKAGKDGVLLNSLNGLVAAAVGTRISTMPDKTWRAYLTAPARGGQFVCDPKGPTARVRLAHPPTP